MHINYNRVKQFMLKTNNRRLEKLSLAQPNERDISYLKKDQLNSE